MAREKKATGTRVADQFHIGLRFEPEVRDSLLQVVHHENGLLLAAGSIPSTTPSSLIKQWVRERIEAELLARGHGIKTRKVKASKDAMSRKSKTKDLSTSLARHLKNVEHVGRKKASDD
jgi:hypothetical protein